MREALKGNAWILKIKIDTPVTAAHVHEFFSLWVLVNEVHLDEHAEDDITWKHSNDGMYSASSAYKAQFLGLILSPMDFMVWKAWAPPKVKFFSWLALQDWIWTADRLARRGWPNCGLCQLCKRGQESGVHLFFKCRHTLRLLRMLIDKLGLVHMDTTTWHLAGSVKEWWEKRTNLQNPNRRAMASLTMLVSWSVWNERNARVFRRKSAPPTILLQMVLDEANLWVTAGARKLGDIILRE